MTESISKNAGIEANIPVYIRDLQRIMSNNLIYRFIRANITHWLEEDLKSSRTYSLNYWQTVEMYFVKSLY